MRVVLFLGQNVTLENFDLNNCYLIGVDRGALILASYNIKMDLAIGDFDSIDSFGLKIVEKYSKKIIKLNPIKDDSDTSAALDEAIKISKDITILGGVNGSRVEHLLSNIFLLNKFEYVKMLDDNSLIFVTKESIKLHKDQYRYVSIFALDDTIISLEGFRYNLVDYHMREYDPLGLSNELEEDDAKITITKGKVIIIKSKDDKNVSKQ